jgi:hypothetical protein
MDPDWRRNAAQWMEKRAALFELRYTLGEISQLDLMSDNVQDAMDAWQDERQANPVAWIRTTELYRALIADLPMAVTG